VSKPTKQMEIGARVLPENFLNAYELINPDDFEWRVTTYRFVRTDKGRQTHKDRGEIKKAMWDLFRQHKARCHGDRFVIDTDAFTVAVPEGWDIPTPTVQGEYEVTRERTFLAKADDPRSQAVVAGLIREGLKRYFKNNYSEDLGDLWQDYDRFCQAPNERVDNDYSLCRRFGVYAKPLHGHRWVVECTAGTAMIDGRTFADYYRAGRVSELAGMMELKRGDKVDRQNRPIAIRALRDRPGDFGHEISAVELESPEIIFAQCSMSEREQKVLADGAIMCSTFPQPAESVPLSELRLILDSQITQEDHSETIIKPAERERFMRLVRDFINGAEIFGQELRLAESPFDLNGLKRSFVRPPAIRVKGKGDTEQIIRAPAANNEELLHKRARMRSDNIRKYGYLQQRPIDPLLAWPERMGAPAAERMLKDLNEILEWQGVNFRFRLYRYQRVEDIRLEIERVGCDALLAVLPEGRREPHRTGSTHEQIKQGIEAPSQCIQYDHTMSLRWIDRPYEEFMEKDPKMARRIRQRYELSILSLLVKHHWIPFAPADAFNFNVQVGLDVGGTHNTDVVSCMGYGFRRPQDELIFRPDEIPVGRGKVEPIPEDKLYEGLLRQFETMRSQLIESKREVDFDRTLFYRDGQLLGDGDAWNEKKALLRLHAELLSRGWVKEGSIWAAVEVMKFAEGWRVMRDKDGVTNPLAGECVYLFDDESTILLCTTGSPYLTQGTACPIMIRVVPIHGEADKNEIIRDLFWQADMCFTKPDTGMRLPWVLNVADTGALQQSRSYKITGITA